MTARLPSFQAACRAAMDGGSWVLLNFVLTRGLQLVAMAVLARLLTPADWGVVALANIALGVVLLFYDMGTNAALIQTQERTEDAANWVFYVNLALGVVWYIVVWTLAPFYGSFFADENLPHILKVMGLVFLITPFGAVHQALLTRRLLFKQKFYIEFSSLLIGSVLSIVLALVGWGVWSLVFGSLATQVCQTLLAWTSVAWRPRASLSDWALVGHLARFGGSISLQGCLVWIINTLDNILIGKWWNPTALGLYELGFRLGTWPATNITNACSGIFYPLFSRLQHDLPSLQHTYLKAINIVSLTTVPLGIGIAATSSLFVPLYFGVAWIPAIPVIQYVSVYGILASIGGVMAPLCNAMGRPEILVKYLTFSVLTAVPAFTLAAPYGVAMMALSHLVLVCLRFPLDLMIPVRLLRLSYRDMWEAIRVSVVASAVMGTLVVALREVLARFTELGDSLILVTVVTFGVCAYVGSIYAFSRETYDTIVGFSQQVFLTRPLLEKGGRGGLE